MQVFVPQFWSTSGGRFSLTRLGLDWAFNPCRRFQSMKRVPYFFLTVAVALALAIPAFAQQQTDHRTAAPPLVQLLQSKGILTAEEADNISQASSAEEANARLAQLLVEIGRASQQEFNNTV